jgi:hypothetical protein
MPAKLMSDLGRREDLAETNLSIALLEGGDQSHLDAFPVKLTYIPAETGTQIKQQDFKAMIQRAPDVKESTILYGGVRRFSRWLLDFIEACEIQAFTLTSIIYIFSRGMMINPKSEAYFKFKLISDRDLRTPSHLLITVEQQLTEYLRLQAKMGDYLEEPFSMPKLRMDLMAIRMQSREDLQ